MYKDDAGFPKVFLIFRIERDSSFPDDKQLCEIFTDPAKANKDCEERNKRHGDKWIYYKVEEWEIQE